MDVAAIGSLALAIFLGVDIAPIIWFGIFSLLREILLGQQGLLKMMG